MKKGCTTAESGGRGPVPGPIRSKTLAFRLGRLAVHARFLWGQFLCLADSVSYSAADRQRLMELREEQRLKTLGILDTIEADFTAAALSPDQKDSARRGLQEMRAILTEAEPEPIQEGVLEYEDHLLEQAGTTSLVTWGQTTRLKIVCEAGLVESSLGSIGEQAGLPDDVVYIGKEVGRVECPDSHVDLLLDPEGCADRGDFKAIANRTFEPGELPPDTNWQSLCRAAATAAGLTLTDGPLEPENVANHIEGLLAPTQAGQMERPAYEVTGNTVRFHDEEWDVEEEVAEFFGLLIISKATYITASDIEAASPSLTPFRMDRFLKKIPKDLQKYVETNNKGMRFRPSGDAPAPTKRSPSRN